MSKFLMVVYSGVVYVFFLATFLYAIGFVGGVFVPKSIDSGEVRPAAEAVLVNLLLLGLFAVQHSVMARPAFKRAWTRVVPEPIERSTYVLASSVALIALFAFWQPMGGVVWNIEAPAARATLHTIFVLGWLTVLGSTFLINHFDLFGLRQVWLYFRGRPYTHLPFGTPGPYRWVRHPLYVGWLLAFWATPTMTVAHLVFALMTTAYILVAIRFEERDLVDAHGETYQRYREEVPMLVPRPPRRDELDTVARVRF